MLAANLTVDKLATKVGVDPKTVERWISNEDRHPRRAARHMLTQVLEVREADLWPALANDARPAPTESELVHLYPSRSAMTGAAWEALLNGVEESMDVLVFSGAFLVEQYNLIPLIREKANSGVKFRILVGDEKFPGRHPTRNRRRNTRRPRGPNTTHAPIPRRRCRHRRRRSAHTRNYSVQLNLSVRRRTLSERTFPRSIGWTKPGDASQANAKRADLAALHAFVRTDMVHSDTRRITGDDLMARVDYFDDPAAPAANSVVPSVTVAVLDGEDRILLIHKIDNDLWALPGGGHDVGERITDTAIREVREETGLDIELIRLVGTYTDPRHVMAYDDGEVRQQFSLCFEGRRIGGIPREDGTETKAVRWVATTDLDKLNIHPSMRLRIDHALDSGRQAPYLG